MLCNICPNSGQNSSLRSNGLCAADWPQYHAGSVRTLTWRAVYTERISQKLLQTPAVLRTNVLKTVPSGQRNLATVIIYVTDFSLHPVPQSASCPHYQFMTYKCGDITTHNSTNIRFCRLTILYRTMKTLSLAWDLRFSRRDYEECRLLGCGSFKNQRLGECLDFIYLEGGDTFLNLKTVAPRSSETSVFKRPTRSHIPEDGILQCRWYLPTALLAEASAENETQTRSNKYGVAWIR
jgi:hypothetical protein